ncbi:MAG: hypothetical protein WCG77_01935 [Actinomycetes bacterium]|jgi:hypothetical protein
MPDPSVRRQLRFAIFLQSMALLMMGGACILRQVVIGFDGVTAILGIFALLIIAALVFTSRRLRQTGILPS